MELSDIVRYGEAQLAEPISQLLDLFARDGDLGIEASCVLVKAMFNDALSSEAKKRQVNA